MASQLGNTYQNMILNAVFRGQALTIPANLYMALFTVAPSNAGGGTEVSAAGYARVALPENTSTWAAPSSNSPAQISNSSTVDFGTTTTSWGTPVAWAIMDALTVGNIVTWGTFTSGAIGSGVHVFWSAGLIVVNMGA